jgi:hypothetical protein
MIISNWTFSQIDERLSWVVDSMGGRNTLP